MSIPIGKMGFDEEQTEALENSRIATDDQLWQSLARDPALPETVFPNDPGAASRLFDRLADEARKTGEKIGASPLRAHFPDVFVLALLMLAIYGFFRDRTGVNQVVVAATGGIPAFHPISPSDLTVLPKPLQTGSALRKEEVIGRYSSISLGRGDVVLREKLNAGPVLHGELAGRRILQIKALPSMPASSLKAPVIISLIASPRRTQSAATVFTDVILLAVSVQPDGGLTAVIAVPSEDEPLFAPLIGDSDFVITTAQ
jgi:hypothetical protein